jgi:hypothetical protein
MGQTHGFGVSTRFLERLGSAQGITLATASQSDRDMVAAMLKLLGMVLAASQLEPFVLELARGRFALPRADTPSLGGLPASTPLLRAAIAQLIASTGKPDTAEDSHGSPGAAEGGDIVPAAPPHGNGNLLGSGAAATDMSALTQHLRRSAVTETVRAHKQAQGTLGHTMGVIGTAASPGAASAKALDDVAEVNVSEEATGGKKSVSRRGKKSKR